MIVEPMVAKTNYISFLPRLEDQTNRITAMFMGRTDLTTGLWFPIQKMTWKRQNHEYVDCVTVYTKGALKLEELHPEIPNLVTFGNLSQVFKYRDIYSCSWSNRLPVNRDPDPQTLEYLGLDPDALVDPILYAERSGGYRHGDRQDLFPEVQADERGNYNFVFRNVDAFQFTTANRPQLHQIQIGEAVTADLVEGKIRLNCQGYDVGSAPPYIRELSKKYRADLNICIYQVNPNAPFEYQFLFKASLNQEIGIPFCEPEYEPLNG